MPKFSEHDIEDIVGLLTEGMADAGFTGTKFDRGQIPQSSWEIFTREQQDGSGAEPLPQEFSDEIVYHRVTTDQGTFGLWLEPFVTLDLGGTGVSKAFLPPDVSADPVLGDWCFIALEENTFQRLFTELTKNRRQP